MQVGSRELGKDSVYDEMANTHNVYSVSTLSTTYFSFTFSSHHFSQSSGVHCWIMAFLTFYRCCLPCTRSVQFVSTYCLMDPKNSSCQRRLFWQSRPSLISQPLSMFHTQPDIRMEAFQPVVLTFVPKHEFWIP